MSLPRWASRGPPAYKWLARFRAEGRAGLVDRSSRPRRSPTRTAASVEAAILALRRDRLLGPARIGGGLGVEPLLDGAPGPDPAPDAPTGLDRPADRKGDPTIRAERRPGELVHVYVKKLGAIRPGGGWRMTGRGSTQDHRARTEQHAGRRVGYDFVHCAIDDYTRLAYAEIHADENASPRVPGSCAGQLSGSPASASTTSAP